MKSSVKNNGFWLYFTEYLLLLLFVPALVFIACSVFGFINIFSFDVWAVFIFIIVVAVIIAYLLAKRNYINKSKDDSSVNEDFQQFKDDEEDNSLKESNVINATDDNNSEGNKENELGIKAQWLKSEFVRKLVTSKRLRTEFLKQAKELYNIDVKNKRFGVLVFYSTHNENDSAEVNVAELNKQKFQAFNDVAHAIGNENFEVHPFLINQFIGCVVIMDETDFFGYINPLKRLAKQIQRLVYNYYNIKAVGVCSDIVYSLKEIHNSYDECIEILSHKIVVENNAIPDEFLDVLKDIDVDLGNEKSDSSQAKKEQEKTPEKSSVKKSDAAGGKKNKSAVKSTVAQSAKAPVKKTVTKAEKDTKSKTSEVKVAEKKDVVMPKADEVVPIVSIVIDNTLLAEVKKYIDDNYMNKNISGADVAQEFNVPAANLQKAFREKYKKSISEYVQGVRIKKAKTLLKKKNSTIKDVSEQVGYGTIKTFIETFKKLENTTPGQYKENLQA